MQIVLIKQIEAYNTGTASTAVKAGSWVMCLQLKLLSAALKTETRKQVCTSEMKLWTYRMDVSVSL